MDSSREKVCVGYSSLTCPCIDFEQGVVSCERLKQVSHPNDLVEIWEAELFVVLLNFFADFVLAHSADACIHGQMFAHREALVKSKTLRNISV